MRKTLVSSAITILSLLFCFGVVTASAAPAFSPDGVQEMLQAGNERYASGHAVHPNRGPIHRALAAVGGQHPVATVLASSDSRVPVEILFDQGVGDLFVIKVAGNVADTDVIVSIEQGVDHLGTPLMVILGHTLAGTEADIWKAAADLLAKSPATAARVKAGTLKVVGAVYDIEHGSVNWLGELPNQAEILAAPAAAPAPAAEAVEAKETHAEAAPAVHEAAEEAPAAHGAAAAHEEVKGEESGSSLPIILFVIGIFALIAVMDKTVLKD